ncbi:MAG: phosphopantetheine-binding protein [Nitrosomonadaceae bacterium]|nr:phosphopantetheine-binding protein [Nitrosomonadaceae bacterium]|tara:strand:- start:809 stop:1057 length:249 start_codon:yes stop_codon:yes gene_type:complete
MEYDQNSILQNLCKHLESFVSSEIEITPDTDLINELAIDSVKLLNLIMEIEDEFDISVPINVLADVHTVRDLANLIFKIKSQ